MPTSVFLYPQDTTRVPPLVGHVDIYESESHKIGMDISKYPVESGEHIIDNAVVRPKELTLKGSVSDVLPLPGRRVVSPSHDSNLAWSLILDMFNQRMVLTIGTTIGVYQNMLIESATTTKDASTGRSLMFQLHFIEILRVQPTQQSFTREQLQGGPAQGQSTPIDRGRIETEDLDETLSEQLEEDSLSDSVDEGIMGGADEIAPINYVPPTKTITVHPLLNYAEAKEIPLIDVDNQRFSTNLGNTFVDMNVWRQESDGNYYVTMADVVEGAKLVPGGLIPLRVLHRRDNLTVNGQFPTVDDVKRRLNITNPLYNLQDRLGFNSLDISGALAVFGVGNIDRGSFGLTHKLLYVPKRVF